MNFRSDLAIDQNFVPNLKLENFTQSTSIFDEIKISKFKISSAKSAATLKQKQGKYVTLEHPNLFKPEKENSTIQILINELKPFIENKHEVLIIGLGNNNIAPDSIGPQTANKIFATKHIKNELEKNLKIKNLTSVSVIVPGVLAQTGINTSTLISTISSLIKPDLIIAIDALAAKSPNRIGSTMQITNSGIAPGSGVQQNSIEISKQLLKTDVLAIGVPTMVDFSNFSSEYANNDLMISLKNIELTIKQSTKIISKAINSALFKNLSQKEIEILLG